MNLVLLLRRSRSVGLIVLCIFVLIVSGFFVGRRRGFDGDFGTVGNAIAAGSDDGSFLLEAVGDFGELLGANADLDVGLVSLVVGAGYENVIAAFGRLENGGSRDGESVFNTFGDGFDGDIHAGLKSFAGLQRLEPHFDGGAAGIESGAHEHDASFGGLIDARNSDFGFVANFEENSLRLHDVSFGDELGSVYHRENGLVGGSQFAFVEWTIGDNAVEGTTDLRIAELGFGVEVVSLGLRKLAAGRLEKLILAEAIQVRQLFLRLFVGAACLSQLDFSGIEVAAGQCTLVEERFASIVDFLRGVKGGFGGGSVELGFLNLLRKAGAGGHGVAGFGLFECALALFFGADEISVFELREDLALFHVSAALHVELVDGRSDLWRKYGLLQRIDHRFGGYG